MIEMTAFKWVPAFAQGYVKDLRVRWALEEAGLAYQVRLIDAEVARSGAYRAWQPFGQVPAYRDDDVSLFESGAIVLHIAAKSPALAPPGVAGFSRAAAWVVAALNSVEPQAQKFIELDAGAAGDGARARALAALHARLAALSTWLADSEYLEQGFGAGDLMMTSVLRELVDSGVLADFPLLDRYRLRCEARPAFARSLQAQLQAFRDNAPAGADPA
ncbi:glutathione S-transferase family protein [Caenimonas terrae]|uniref:Glutathione S-transferase family protein n=1 Tax=Caenimonas terrae TaxID=696074 RepID=A0ABW0NH34_9BURK